MSNANVSVAATEDLESCQKCNWVLGTNMDCDTCLWVTLTKGEKSYG